LRFEIGTLRGGIAFLNEMPYAIAQLGEGSIFRI
jgi:hypothetical protein